MLLMFKPDCFVPHAIKVNADEYFRAVKKCQASGDTEMVFNSADNTAIVDLLEDPVTYNNTERTVIITPDAQVSEWLE